MSASNYVENLVINWLFRGQALTSPGVVYVSLHTADPGEDGTTGELTDTNYARTSAGATPSTAWDAPTNGVTSNNNVVTFPALADAGTVVVTHYGFWDAATAGNYLGGNALQSTKSLDQSDVPSFPVAAFTATMT